MRAAVLFLWMLTLNMPLQAWDGPCADAASTQAAEDLCSKLIANAKEIDALLHTIRDTASADAAAPQLEKKLQEMRALLAGLETLPFDAETTQIITNNMMELTHLYQSYMPLIQELIDKNAYGSVALLEHLRKHNADNDIYADADTDVAIPYADIYQRMETALNRAVYNLRKATDIYTATEAAGIVSESYALQQSLMKELTTLQNLEPHPAENQAIPESITQLKAELERELERLRELQFFGEPDLPSLIPAYLKLIP